MDKEGIRTMRRRVGMAAVVGASALLAVGICEASAHMKKSKGEVAYEELEEDSTGKGAEATLRYPVWVPHVDSKAVKAASAMGVSKSTMAEMICEAEPEGEDEENAVAEKEPARTEAMFTEEERTLLLQVAMAEAGNQDIEGKALVMLVVANRASGDNGFPDTIGGVLYQPHQFEVVSKGIFWNYLPDDGCHEALRLVESGWDGSQGATYFESKSGSTWHTDNLLFLFKHGDHYFYRER